MSAPWLLGGPKVLFVKVIVAPSMTQPRVPETLLFEIVPVVGPLMYAGCRSV